MLCLVISTHLLARLCGEEGRQRRVLTRRRGDRGELRRDALPQFGEKRERRLVLLVGLLFGVRFGGGRLFGHIGLTGWGDCPTGSGGERRAMDGRAEEGRDGRRRGSGAVSAVGLPTMQQY